MTARPAGARRRYLAIALLVAVTGGPVAAQQRPPREVPRPQEFVGSQDDSLFSITRSQENAFEWEQALQELERGEVRVAVERLHRLLETEIGGVAQVDAGRYHGLRQAVVTTLANLSPAAEAAYEDLVKRQAGSLFDAPLQQLLPEQLQLLAERFPASRLGRQARLRLGDLLLVAGDGLAAAGHFRAARDAARIGSSFESSVLERLLVADTLCRPGARRGEAAPPPPVAAALAVRPPAADPTDWPASGGGYGGCQLMAPLVGRPQLRSHEEVTAQGFEYSSNGSHAMQAVGDLSAIYLNTGLELLAFDPLRGELLWASPSPLRDQGNLRSMREYQESINQDMVLAAAVGGDVVVAALQVPDDSSTINFQGTFSIMRRLPERRLFAFQRSTGKLLWAHFDQLDGPVSRRFRGHLAAGPPLVLGDTVYAPVHDRSGAIAFYLAAYDLWTGKPRWRRLVCSSQQEVNMFGNARQEYASSPLCAHDGVLFGTSNLGVAYAIDMHSGRVRWLSAYEVIRMPPTQLHRQITRPTYFNNSSPLVQDGVVCLTPLDSEYVIGLDCETGRTLWRMPYQAKVRGNADVRWLFGAVDGEFLLAGKAVVAVKARPTADTGGGAVLRLVRGSEFLGTEPRGEIPRPALTEQRQILFAAPGRVSVFDTEGVMVAAAPNVRLNAPGNLLLVDGMLIAISNRSFEVHYDPAALRALTEERVRQNPRDPAAILRLCSLREAVLGSDDPDGARSLEQLYDQGLKACIALGLPPEDRLRATFQRHVFTTALQSAMRATGEQAAAALRRARELAPDTAAFLRAQAALIALSAGDDRALSLELDVLLERAAEASFPFPDAGGPVPVGAYVLWRRARIAKDPAASIGLWQELLERFGEAVISGRSCRELAYAAIGELLAQHGAHAYAAIEARAAAELSRTGSDLDGLRSLAQRFPHSQAAATAATRVLDLAAAAGDLGSTVELLAAIPPGSQPSPSLLRRVLEAALVRGNRAFAAALARRLAAGTDGIASDWPADQGATFASVGRTLAAMLAAPPEAVAPVVPTEVLGAIDSPGARRSFRLLPVELQPGFMAPADLPLYVLAGEYLRAIDLDAPGRPTLFARQVGYLERIFACGKTIVVPELSQLVALDHRTGLVSWTLATNEYVECLGFVDGVLLASLSGNDDANAKLVGIEPLSGRTLFSRQLPTGSQGATPKPWRSGVLYLHTPLGGEVAIERIEVLTGRTIQRVPLQAGLLRSLQLREDALRAARLFPQGFAADDERIYLPADGELVDGPPRIAAVRSDGSLQWSWTGTPGRRFVVHALRDSQLLVVEAGRPGAGRAIVLDAATGRVDREVQLGEDVQAQNWSRNWLLSPAPPALLCTDIDAQGDRRLVCIGLDPALPSFVLPIGSSSDQLERTPILSPELLLYGVKPRQGTGPLRLHALRPRDRSGALPGGEKYLRLAGSTYGMTMTGPYTVVLAENGLLVLGDGRSLR